MSRDIRLSSEQVEPRLREGFVREMLKPLYVPSPVDGGQGSSLYVRMTIRPAHTLLLWRSAFGRLQYLRDRRLVQRSNVDHFQVMVLLKGSLAGDFDGKAVSAAGGAVFLADLGRPFRFRVEEGAGLTVALDRSSIQKVLGRNSWHGHVYRANEPITQLVADYLLGLYSVAHALTAPQSAGVLEALSDLLLAGSSGHAVMPDRASALSLVFRERILEFIDAHIWDGMLDPDFLMRRFRVSRSHLYRAFEADGGVARVIRNRRLDFAYRRLVTPTTDANSIKEIARDCGYASSSQFIRAFRAHFGVTPRTAQREGVMPPTENCVTRLRKHFETVAGW